MRYLLFLLLLSGCVTKDPAFQDVPAYKVDDARWNEKQRWFKYINDSIQDAAFPIRVEVASGLMTPKQGFDSLLKLIDKAHTPFYK